jgi:hypothetical protein
MWIWDSGMAVPGSVKVLGQHELVILGDAQDDQSNAQQ